MTRDIQWHRTTSRLIDRMRTLLDWSRCQSAASRVRDFDYDIVQTIDFLRDEMLTAQTTRIHAERAARHAHGRFAADDYTANDELANDVPAAAERRVKHVLTSLTDAATLDADILDLLDLLDDITDGADDADPTACRAGLLADQLRSARRSR